MSAPQPATPTYTAELISAIWDNMQKTPWVGHFRGMSTTTLREIPGWVECVPITNQEDDDSVDAKQPTIAVRRLREEQSIRVSHARWLFGERKKYANELFPVFLGRRRALLFDNFAGMEVKNMDDLLQILVHFHYVCVPQVGADGAALGVAQRLEVAHRHMSGIMKQLADQVWKMLEELTPEQKATCIVEGDLGALYEEHEFADGSSAPTTWASSQTSSQSKYEI
ncbi:hypothetical protein CH35J_012854 [Colletotrichum higginsianum]|uniref:Uncharacterized protein n=1 Tax=Colletotrichum higginsianum TaxID=80884 RepID=A0A4T0VBU4_9PEZI|nr:hypothetical protein CH35J_012891 [Colletotrichum higginsianum]TIC89464.1 hypothetical protein CH35J_012854 [Colletotrichum higginsianum]